MTVAHRLVFPLCLLVGPLLVIVAGTLHPDLAGDGAAQLAAIAQCSAWRAIHWTFLFSFPLALTGLVGLARVHAGNPGESAVRAGLIVDVRLRSVDGNRGVHGRRGGVSGAQL